MLGVYATLETQPQFIPRLTNVPRSLRPVFVSHCDRCPEYVVYDSLLQHSCVLSTPQVRCSAVVLFSLPLCFSFGCTYNNTAWIGSWCHLIAIDTGWYPISGISLLPFLLRIGTALFRPFLFSPTGMHFSYSLFRGRSLTCPI